MPSSYLNTVAPKWAASANADIEGRTVQFYPLPLEGNANITSTSVTVLGTWGQTQFAETATRRSEIEEGDTLMIRPLLTGNYTNARVVTLITDAGNLNVNYAMSTTANAQVMVRAKYFVVPHRGGWASAKYLQGNANTTAAASNATLTGYGTRWALDLKAGDHITIVGTNVNAQTATVASVTNNTTVALNANVLITNNHAVFRIIEILQTIPGLEAQIS